MDRPVKKYQLGLHHLAQPTLDPKATLEFYVDTMGAKITHCISSKGWRPNHFDYIHMFLEIDRDETEGNWRAPDNIAMFYYFGAESWDQVPKYGTHHSFAAKDIEELDAWEKWLTQRGHKIVWRADYEIMSSIYVWDPNGRFLEIAAQHRALNAIDADDAELTAQALVLAAEEKATSIHRMWEHKARLIEERDGAINGPALLFPKVDEFASLRDAAQSNARQSYDRGNFDVVEGNGELRLQKPEALSEAVWWSVGTGGLKGHIEHFDDRELVIR
jgi:catechol 2,3-dioxygenase-like lactoylglutathione lyase family enzyme